MGGWGTLLLQRGSAPAHLQEPSPRPLAKVPDCTHNWTAGCDGMIEGGRIVRSPTIRPIRKPGSTPKLHFRLDYRLDLSSLRQASLRQIPRSAIHSRFRGFAHLAGRSRRDIRHGVVVWSIGGLGRFYPRCSSPEPRNPGEFGFVGRTDGESISRRAFQVAVGRRHR